jgi:hypothetical protein
VTWVPTGFLLPPRLVKKLVREITRSIIRTMSSCEPCFRIHGEGCEASYRNEKGEQICVFCEDGIPCPLQLKILRQTRAARATRRDETMNGAEKLQTQVSAARTCKAPGCEARLVSNNKSGFCQKHTPPRSRSRADPKPNGHGGEPAALSGANSHGQDLGAEDRVNLVLSTIPLDAKLRMISNWLEGKT